MFRSENDVRKWMRDGLGDKVRWVEPARGSTLGLPDCWVPIDGTRTQVWVELKLAELCGDRLLFTVRPEQRKQISSMVQDRMIVGVIAGEKGGNRVWAMNINDSVLAGDVDVRSGVAGKWLKELSPSSVVGPTQGVYSIFFGVMADEDG